MRAFDRLKDKRPDLVLQIAWTLKPDLQDELISLVSPRWRSDVHFLGTNVDLPKLFASASVSVLPSLWESQGLVVLESLAAGTPVVVTRDGALPEIVTDLSVGRLFDLPEEAVLILQTVPYKGSLPTAVPTDPLIYRWYEIVNVYGTTIKELIHEEFGDGIMSAIDFSMEIQREPDPKGDRVHVVLSGKFLPYKTY